mgnify:CR=1 FL=1
MGGWVGRWVGGGGEAAIRLSAGRRALAGACVPSCWSLPKWNREYFVVIAQPYPPARIENPPATQNLDPTPNGRFDPDMAACPCSRHRDATQVVASDPDEITPMQRMTAGALAGACAQSTIYPFELVRVPLLPLPPLLLLLPLLLPLPLPLPLRCRRCCCRCCRALDHPRRLGVRPSSAPPLPCPAAPPCSYARLHGPLAAAHRPSLHSQVRTRLAVCPSGTYRGIADCVRKVLAQEGWRAFYRGMVPSMLGILPYAGVDITIFELLKERLLDEVGWVGGGGAPVVARGSPCCPLSQQPLLRGQLAPPPPTHTVVPFCAAGQPTLVAPPSSMYCCAAVRGHQPPGPHHFCPLLHQSPHS